MSDELEQPEQSIAAPRTWPHVVKLQHPVDLGEGERLSSLMFRRGKAGDMKGLRLRDLGHDDLMMIASRMCAQPVAILNQLDVDDVGEVVDIVMDFYVAYLKTGRTR